jgi:putative oxidoreductase
MSDTSNSLGDRFAAFSPQILALLRIVSGALFLEHGMVKVFGFPPHAEPGKVPLVGLFGAAGVLELVGGIMIVLGLFTRPVAFLLSGEMAVAYFMVHAPKSLYPAVNMGDAAILFAFVFLYLAAAGAGTWSFDAMRRKSV